MRFDKLDLAVSHFESVLETDGDNVNAIQNLAHSCARMDKPEMAEKWNSKVVIIVKNQSLFCNSITRKNLRLSIIGKMSAEYVNAASS